MWRLAWIAVLASCGDGRAPAGDAAPAAPDAARAPVRVRVTGFVEKSGLTVYFQERDSTLALATETDAAGEASGLVGPDAFVTLVVKRDLAHTMWTYARVQPGDELVFHEPPTPGVPPPPTSLSVFVSGAQPPFTLHTPCIQTTFPEPVAVPIGACPRTIDLLLVDGAGGYQFRDDFVLGDAPEIEFVAEPTPRALSTVRVTGLPDPRTTLGITHVLWDVIPLDTDLDAPFLVVADAGVAQVAHRLALPARGTLLTQIDPPDPRALHLADWRPATPLTELVLDAVPVRDATQAPRFDATLPAIVWSEGAGVAPDLVHATLHWLDDDSARTRTWEIVAPHEEANGLASVPVPRLPDRELAVPAALAAPDALTVFVAGDQRAWARAELLGQWTRGGLWPAQGAAGRVAWRAL